jgi:hypothetical protein
VVFPLVVSFYKKESVYQRGGRKMASVSSKIRKNQLN